MWSVENTRPKKIKASQGFSRIISENMETSKQDDQRMVESHCLGIINEASFNEMQCLEAMADEFRKQVVSLVFIQETENFRVMVEKLLKL